MTTAGQHARQIAGISRSDWLLMALLLPVYFLVWQRFGQKFLAGAGISFLSGLCCWLLALIFQPGGDKLDVDQIPFGWSLFAFFPIFCPLGLPLWLIPIILIVAYLVAISSFGGYGRHFFNPIIFAVVFMVCGYADTASLGASRPLPSAQSGFTVWTAGMPPSKPLWRIYSTIGLEELLPSSIAGNLPAIPGSAFPGALLAISFVASMAGGRRRIWWLTAALGTICFSLFSSRWLMVELPLLHPLFLGMIPGILLVAVADHTSLPESAGEQIIAGLIFACLAILFIGKSADIFGPVFALLLMQVLSPLVSDLVIGGRAKTDA